MKNLLAINNVSHKIGKKNILQKVSLNLYEKEIVTIVGPNGAGKTTLLLIALGLIKPSSGSVKRYFLGDSLLRIGYVPQSINRDSTMPINVFEFMRLSKNTPSKKEVINLLTAVGLTQLQKSSLNDLSGGELRRVLFARALLNNPHLLVLDEPTAGVDVSGQEFFYHQLNELRKQFHFSILMVSHDLHLVMSATDRVVCLNGHICCQGKPSQVVNNPRYQNLFINESMGQTEKISELAFYQHNHDHTH